MNADQDSEMGTRPTTRSASVQSITAQSGPNSRANSEIDIVVGLVAKLTSVATAWSPFVAPVAGVCTGEQPKMVSMPAVMAEMAMMKYRLLIE
jgi:hypothetical protein